MQDAVQVLVVFRLDLQKLAALLTIVLGSPMQVYESVVRHRFSVNLKTT